MTEKGINTKKKIIYSAAKFFSKKGFYRTSVKDICRSVPLSVGAVYKYFKSKEDILSSITEELSFSISKNFETIPKNIHITKKITLITTKIIQELEKKQELIQAIREFEYNKDSQAAMFYKYISNLIFEYLNFDIKNKTLCEITSWLIISTLSFLISEEEIFGKLESRKISQLIPKILLQGMLKEKIQDSFFEIKNKKNIQNIIKSELLKNAEEIFGKFGYEEAKIYEITRNSGCAVGSFYLQFKSKIDAYRKIVNSLRDELIKTAYTYSINSKTRGEVEVKAFLALFDFALNHPYGYKIIAESKFIDKRLYLGYYKYIYENYKKQLSKKENINSFNIKEPNITAKLMMSIGHSVALKKIVWKDIEISEKELIKIVLNGINNLKEV